MKSKAAKCKVLHCGQNGIVHHCRQGSSWLESSFAKKGRGFLVNRSWIQKQECSTRECLLWWHLWDHIWSTVSGFGFLGTKKDTGTLVWVNWKAIRVVLGLEHMAYSERLSKQGLLSGILLLYTAAENMQSFPVQALNDQSRLALQVGGWNRSSPDDPSNIN